MNKKIISVCLSILLILSSVCTVSFASDGTKIDVTTSAVLTDASYVRYKESDKNQGTDPLVVHNDSWNKRIPLLKFDLSGCSPDEIESCNRAELVLTKSDALSFVGVDVILLDESLNSWSGASVTYNTANSAGMLTGGTKINTDTGTYSDTTTMATIPLDAGAIASALRSSTSKVFSLRIDPLTTTSTAWVFIGMSLNEAERPKLSFITEVDIEEEMKAVKDNLSFSDISSESETSVTEDLDFESETSGKYGIKIEWSSLNEDVVASDGSVICPIENFGQADAQATIRATISYPANSSVQSLTKDFIITVPARSLTAAEFVEEEIKAFGFDKIKGANASADSVTENLDFSYQGIFDGTSITYSTSDPAVSSDGTVTRPPVGFPELDVTITAHISNGGSDGTASVTVTIPSEEIPENLLLNKEIYASAKVIISRTKPDVAEERNEPVVSKTGNERFSFVRFDLSELNDEELSSIDASILRLYTTPEALTVNSNFVISIVDDSLEDYLEADSSAATYNKCVANGLLSPTATTVLYDSGNVLQAGQNYETSNISEAINDNLASSSNKVIWLKVESTTGTIVFGSIKAPDTSMRPTLKLKYLMTKAQRDIESLTLENVVTQNLDLPAKGVNGADITWSTSDDEVVTSDGVINRFDIGENYALEDTTAILTATTSNAWATYTKDFSIRVKMGGVIDATHDASIGASQAITSGSELSIGGSDDYMSALVFDFKSADKTMITRGRKTVLKLYGDASQFAGKSINMYAIAQNKLSELADLSSINHSALDALLEGCAKQTSTIGSGGYAIFDVSDYVRNLSGSTAAFVLTTDGAPVRICSLDGEDVTKLPKLIVSNQEYTDEYGAQMAAEGISFSQLTNDPQNALRFDLNLPQTGIYNSTITWSASPEGAINTTTGALNRTGENQNVTLVATATVGDKTATKSFEVTLVKAETPSEYLEYLLEGITLPQTNLTSSIILPGEELLNLGFADSVEWSSSEDFEAEVSGFELKVTRPSSADLAATLTLKVTFGDAVAEKDFGIWILRSSADNILRGRQVISGDASASNAVDENIDTVWQMRNKTVVFNLNAKRVISSITLVPYQSAINGIKVLVSDDNITYTEVYNGGNFTAEKPGYITFAPVAFGKYIKLEFPSGAKGLRFLAAYTTSDEAANDVFASIKLPESASESFIIPTTAAGAAIEWTSSSPAIVINGTKATVTLQSTGVNVVLTAKVVIDNKELVKKYVVSIPAKSGGSSGRPTGSSGGGSISSSLPSVPVVPSAPQPAFSDLGDAQWASEYITYLADKNIINGYGDGTFRPNAFITREEMAKLLCSVFEIEASTKQTDFADVDQSAWYYSHVGALASAGHTSGIGGGLFGIGQAISRQDAFTMLASVLGIKNTSSELFTGFADDESIAPYARLAILALQSEGIVGGDNFGNVNPTAGITRAETAKIICLSQNIKK